LRDLSLQVPINFITKPGVSTSAACFAQNHYEDHEFGKCLSNLMAGGFRLLELDVYWDQTRRIWGFCPVSRITDEAANISSASIADASATSSEQESSTRKSFTGSSAVTASSESSTAHSEASSASSSTASLSAIEKRATTVAPTITSNHQIASQSSLTLAENTTAPVSSVPSFGNNPLYQIGQYECTDTIDISVLSSLLSDYMEQTETTVEAHIIYLTINIHAVRNASDVAGPTPEPTTFPSEAQSLAAALGILQGNLTAYTYGPSTLKGDRADLNASWFDINSDYAPLTAYFNMTAAANDVVSTDDGWPSEGYVEFKHGRRILVQYGNIDPQMTQYNRSWDKEVIFPENELEVDKAVAINIAGNVTSGCYFQQNIRDITKANSSWAMTSNLGLSNDTIIPLSSLADLYNTTAQLVACGITPFLNQTLLDQRASVNATPYLGFSHATNWSWKLGQPSNGTSDEQKSGLFHCAVMDLKDLGRWSVSDCSKQHKGSCRIGDGPYNWTLSSFSTSYSGQSTDNCPNGSTFDVPRTGLENTHLYYTALGAKDVGDDRQIWVDFNSLDTPSCWVKGGANATCPYFRNDQDEKKKAVIVPLVAAIIIVVLALLTIFVKCGANRRVSRRKKIKKGDDGWDYEGVPS
jgi:hypothetical protein